MVNRFIINLSRTKDINAAIEARWSPGTWLGRNWGSITNMVATRIGEVREARAVQRGAKTERCSRETVSAVSDATWGSAVAAPDEAPSVIPPRTQEEREQHPQETTEEGSEYAPERVYIRPEDLEKYGYTAIC